MNWKYSIFITLVLVVISGISGYKFAPGKVQYIERTVVEVDTVYTQKVETIYKWLPSETKVVEKIIESVETIVDTVWMQQPIDRAHFSDSHCPARGIRG